MKITDFLRHDAQAYGVQESPSIERILEVCVEAANWIDELEQRLAQAERERDAAVETLRDAAYCSDCVYLGVNAEEEPCFTCAKIMYKKTKLGMARSMRGEQQGGLKDERIRFDEATKNWFKTHPEAVTTVRECEKCGLYYKPGLRHKCKEDKADEGRT